MSESSESLNVTFRNCDIGYEPSFDRKFVDHIYKLILNGNIKELKKIISEIRLEREKNERTNVNNFTIADEYSENEDFDALEDDETDGDYNNKIADIILPNGFKPLILAGQVVITELVEYFISLEFDANCKDVRTGMTPILAVCCSIPRNNITKDNHIRNVKECLRLLIDAGAIITCALLQNNEYPLHLLTYNNYVEPCEYLIPFVENVDCRNDKRSTPLMLAASRGHMEIVRLLLKAGADISLRNINGHSSAELAMVNNHHDIARILLNESDHLEFYEAWSLIHQELITKEYSRNIRESFTKNFNSSYQDDPLGYMCTNLNLTHLQPILDKSCVTFTQLRCMSDTDLKDIGITRFADRKCLLNIFQEIHKYPWNHETSILTPDYRKAVRPNELIDVIETVNNHLDFLEATMKYLTLHLTVNSAYYSREIKMKSFLDKISNHCEVNSFETNTIHKNVLLIHSFFNKVLEHAVEEDLSSQLNDDFEMEKQRKLRQKYSTAVVKAGIILSGFSIVFVVLWKSNLLRQ